MTSDAPGIGATCVHCGSALRATAPYCTACGQAVTDRPIGSPHTAATSVAAQPDASSAGPGAQPSAVVGAGRAVRCSAAALDLAALVSPALPLTMTAVLLRVAAVVYVVVPAAFVAGWIWMSIWQGLTGMSLGKALLGLRAVRAADLRAPGVGPTAMRGVLFAGSAGLAALPILACAAPRDGLHDRLTGITVIDVSVGANPLGPRQQTSLRARIDRGLRKVYSPVPVPAAQHLAAGAHRFTAGRP